MNARREKIEECTHEGISMFWEHIASQYPEAKAGDLSANMITRIEALLTSAVEEWVEFNSPAERPDITILDVGFARQWQSLEAITQDLSADDQEIIITSIEEGLSKFNRYKDYSDITYAQLAEEIVRAWKIGEGTLLSSIIK